MLIIMILLFIKEIISNRKEMFEKSYKVEIYFCVNNKTEEI